MDPNLPQSHPVVSQPTIIQSASSTEAQAPTPKSHLKMFVVLGVLLLIIVLGGGGWYLYSQRNLGSTSNSKVNVPVPLASQTASNFNVDDSNWLTFDSPCMSFKYPSDWKTSGPTIIQKHQKNAFGVDSFGFTEVRFQSPSLLVNGVDYGISEIHLTCGQKVPSSTLDSIQKGLIDTHNRPQKIQQITFNGVSAIQAITDSTSPEGTSNQGILVVRGFKGNSSFDAILSWISTNVNDLNSPPMQIYNKLLNSVQVKDIQ
jgi:hypothetical protein